MARHRRSRPSPADQPAQQAAPQPAQQDPAVAFQTQIAYAAALVQRLKAQIMQSQQASAGRRF
jgi:hypothetical protein